MLFTFTIVSYAFKHILVESIGIFKIKKQFDIMSNESLKLNIINYQNDSIMSNVIMFEKCISTPSMCIKGLLVAHNYDSINLKH